VKSKEGKECLSAEGAPLFSSEKGERRKGKCHKYVDFTLYGRREEEKKERGTSRSVF